MRNPDLVLQAQMKSIYRVYRESPRRFDTEERLLAVYALRQFAVFLAVAGVRRGKTSVACQCRLHFANRLKYEASRAESLVDVTGVYMWLSERTVEKGGGGVAAFS
jgi:hypothetical protein